MVDEIEARINDILASGSNLIDKRLEIKRVIDAIPSTSTKMVFLHAFKNYRWPKDERESLSEFRLTNFERIKGREDVYFPGWAIDIFDDTTYSKHHELVRAIDRILRERNLPNGLYSSITEQIEDGFRGSGENKYNEDSLRRDFSYKVDYKSGELIDVSLVEKRTRNKEDSTETFVDHFDVSYYGDDVVEERTLALDENKLDEICSRQVFINSKKVLEEYCNDNHNKKPYTEDEISSVLALGEVDPNSAIYKNAIKNIRNYVYKKYSDYSIDFSFGRGYRDEDYFSYGYFISSNGINLVIHIRNQEAEVKAYSASPGYEDLSYEDFIKGNENSEVLIKVQEIFKKLEALGIRVTYAKTETSHKSK